MSLTFTRYHLPGIIYIVFFTILSYVVIVYRLHRFFHYRISVSYVVTVYRFWISLSFYRHRVGLRWSLSFIVFFFIIVIIGRYRSSWYFTDHRYIYRYSFPLSRWYRTREGVTEETCGLRAMVKEAYGALGLQTYFTSGETETRAWTICSGWTAPQAAGVIHSDFERCDVGIKYVCSRVLPVCQHRSVWYPLGSPTSAIS